MEREQDMHNIDKNTDFGPKSISFRAQEIKMRHDFLGTPISWEGAIFLANEKVRQLRREKALDKMILKNEQKLIQSGADRLVFNN
jgi:hypothetical protein